MKEKEAAPDNMNEIEVQSMTPKEEFDEFFDFFMVLYKESNARAQKYKKYLERTLCFFIPLTAGLIIHLLK